MGLVGEMWETWFLKITPNSIGAKIVQVKGFMPWAFFCLFCFIFPAGFHWILWMDGFRLLLYCVLSERRFLLWWTLIFSGFSIPIWKNENFITSAKTWSRMRDIWKTRRKKPNYAAGLKALTCQRSRRKPLCSGHRMPPTSWWCSP